MGARRVRSPGGRFVDADHCTDRCADSRAPIYSAFYSCSEAAISSQLERLILPLAADGKTIDQFLVAIYRAAT